MKTASPITEMGDKEIKIGVLGGMGTLTGGDFVNELTVAFTKHFKNEREHPTFVMYSNSHMPRRDKSIEKEDDSELIEHLEKAMDFFITNNATFIAAPCNTLMYYKDRLELYIRKQGKNIPILDIVQITASATDKLLPDVEKIGLISTKATAEKGLYDKAFAACSRSVVRDLVKLDDKHQKLAVEVLEAIKIGEHTNPNKEPKLLEKIGCCISYLEEKGAKAIVLGCTEFPLLINNENNKTGRVPLISSTQCLIEASIDCVHIFERLLERAKLLKRVGIKHDQNNYFVDKQKISSFSKHVGNLCAYMASNVGEKQKPALVFAINKLLGNDLPEKLSAGNLGAAKDSLIEALANKYPHSQNPLQEFLGSLKSTMKENFPFKKEFLNLLGIGRSQDGKFHSKM